ncbi:MAG: hypothetical protein IJ424_05645 [Oscillospiraceae bacterium]|nr:hypothetical protein [Oscillospiraceae bacterium]
MTKNIRAKRAKMLVSPIFLSALDKKVQVGYTVCSAVIGNLPQYFEVSVKKNY